jgi:hypothetical protein
MKKSLSPFFPSFLPFAVPADKIRLDTTTKPEPDLRLVAELLSIEQEVECTDEVHEMLIEEDINRCFETLFGC